MFFWICALFSSLLAITGNCTEVASCSNCSQQQETFAERKELSYRSLEDLSMEYDVFLLDAYGVFWGSSEVGVLPGSAESMAFLVSQGKTVGILSNSTQPAAKEKEKLRKHGLFEGVHYHFLITSGEVAKDILERGALPFPTPRNTFCLFGSPHPRFGSHAPLFEGTRYREVDSIEKADFLYVSIPHIDGVDQEDPEVFRERVQSVKESLPILCVNPDLFAMEGSPPRPVVRQGSIARLFREEKAQVYLIGKPSHLIFEAALQYIPAGIPKEKMVMIGDTPETDIRGAHSFGIDAALVTKTGVMVPHFEKSGEEEVLGNLPSSDIPEYLLESL